MLEVLIGFAIALTIGLSGVGGGTIMAPVLILALGVRPEIAVGTALLFSVFAKIPAGLVYLRRGNVSFAVLRQMLVGGLPAVIAGTLLLGSLKNEKNLILFWVGITVILCTLINLILTLWKNARPRRFGPAVLSGIAAFIGLEVGFSSAGAGALGTLLLVSGTKLAPAAVVGTDIWFGLALSLIGGGLHAAMGQMDLGLLAKLAAGGLVGSWVGAYLASHVPRKPFKLGLLLWLMFIGSNLVLKGIR